jgi:PAS domain S-box-containing protein
MSQLKAGLSNCRSVKDEWKWSFENSLDMLIVHDKNGNVLHVNRAVERILGYTAEETMQTALRDVIHPDDRQKPLSILPTTPVAPRASY